MPEILRSSTTLPALRTPFHVITSDGIDLIGEVAAPLGVSRGGILCLHPLPTAGGMMDSHIFKKAANRLPAMAGITVVRFNSRGTTSKAGSSTGEFDNGNAEALDVQAMLAYCFESLKLENVWVVGWSFGTELALRHAKDARHKGLILLSPPLRTTSDDDLLYWNSDPRPITALVPELDDYLRPEEARIRFAILPTLKIEAVAGAKHLWLGEPSVHHVLSQINSIVTGDSAELPLEF
ncbi:MAG: alpha/beta fold hydrolase [Candidatus Planktophila sp.]|nr:alpha/beta fold hydrolase [Candidatus Planktophila sp.]